MRHVIPALCAAAAVFAVAPAARADVTAKSETGFVSRNAVEVSAAPDAVWTALTTPSGWWNGEHTFSGDAKNLTLNPVAGGCFCEKLPAPAGSPPRAPMGGVEHMRVTNVQPGKVLRLAGALGPLQSEAASGVLTITMKASDKGTRILFEYVVGGYMRYKTDDIAPAVDTVMKDQLSGLAIKVDPSLASKAAPATPPPASAVPAAAAPAAKAKPKAAPARPAAAAPPAPRDESADQARGANAAAAMAAMEASIAATSARPAAARAATATPAASPATIAYVTRRFTVRKLATGGFVLADKAAPGTQVTAQFSGKAVADRFASAWTAGSTAANRSKDIVCSCTGRFTGTGTSRAFSVIDAAFSYE